ncbi:hypothetical protein [Streptomyces corynorhini]|uniref:Uncharacterized protein n=1 Tax=Streptomyces corynorhini TaxID=2282652 RepID=A0A370B9Q8_9ACTN|nr:hypothetical protein [Streptomyces corynorhini]RDG37119.1 hypothetical protein DVH02_16525 [Streptomyces corynorhini]
MTAAVHEPLRDWYRAYPPFTVGGSLYAVPPAHRAATAAALAERDCRVHVDIIVDAAGRGLGVSRHELDRARALAPGARIDLHLIVADALPAAATAEIVGATVATAARLGVEAVTMDLARIERCPTATTRSTGPASRSGWSTPPGRASRNFPPASTDPW